jgi:hypothetical protein
MNFGQNSKNNGQNSDNFGQNSFRCQPIPLSDNNVTEADLVCPGARFE